MKIALVIERMDTARGGRETSTAQIAISLARQNMDVTIICQEGSFAHDDIKIIQLPAPSGSGRKAKLQAFYRDISSHLQNHSYNIVHTMLPIPGADVYQPRSGSIPGQRSAAIRRRNQPGRFFAALGWRFNATRRMMSKVEHKMMRNKKVVVLPGSEMVAEEFHKYYGSGINIRTIFNAVDTPDFSDEAIADMRRRKRWELGIDDNTTVFIIIATNWKLKGVGETIHAFAKWQQANPLKPARLVAIGRDEPAKYALQAEKSGVGEKVDFPGKCSDVNPWYAAADVCILPSWYDPCSRVILEALAWNLPAITTTYNGASEALAGGAGIVVKSPNSTGEIVAAIDELADAGNRANYIRPRNDKASNLGIDRHVAELIQVYNEVIKER